MEIAEKWTAQARLAPSVNIASSKIYKSILEACSKILKRVSQKYPNVKFEKYGKKPNTCGLDIEKDKTMYEWLNKKRLPNFKTRYVAYIDKGNSKITEYEEVMGG